MSTVSNSNDREVIAEDVFVNDDLGQMVAIHDHDGPTIRVLIAPEDTGESVAFGLSPCEARKLSDQLRAIADTAQRAGWTPAVLADVREHYLPGATDEQIITRLDELTQILGSSPLGVRRGTVHPDAGRMLAADAGVDVVRNVLAAVDQAADGLADAARASSRLTGARTSLDGLLRFYDTERRRAR